jgi:hypothetical protein
MFQITDRGDAHPDDVVTAAALDVNDKVDATGVVFVSRVV